MLLVLKFRQFFNELNPILSNSYCRMEMFKKHGLFSWCYTIFQKHTYFTITRDCCFSYYCRACIDRLQKLKMMRKLVAILLGLILLTSFKQDNVIELETICYTSTEGKQESFTPYAANSIVVFRFKDGVTMHIRYSQFENIKKGIMANGGLNAENRTLLAKTWAFVMISKNGKRYIKYSGPEISFFGLNGDLIIAYPEIADRLDPEIIEEAFDIVIKKDCVSSFLKVLDFKGETNKE